MRRDFPEGGSTGLRYHIGDIRDYERVRRSIGNRHRYVLHTAALKRVDTGEYEPWEFVQTNVNGSWNVIRACHESGVERCMLISTDKAVAPITHYGATKLCMERLGIGANNLGTCGISICRYANVTGSTGSVLPLWQSQKEKGKPLTITDKRMTRMWISKEDAAEFVLYCLNCFERGCIFVPKFVRARRLIDMAREIAPEPYPVTEIGLRPHEKLHEVLISEGDARHTYEQDIRYTIYPAQHDWGKVPRRGVQCDETFRLSSAVLTGGEG